MRAESAAPHALGDTAGGTGQAWRSYTFGSWKHRDTLPAHPQHPVFTETNRIPNSAASGGHPRGSREAAAKGRSRGRRAPVAGAVDTAALCQLHARGSEPRPGGGWGRWALLGGKEQAGSCPPPAGLSWALSLEGCLGQPSPCGSHPPHAGPKVPQVPRPSRTYCWTWHLVASGPGLWSHSSLGWLYVCALGDP